MNRPSRETIARSLREMAGLLSLAGSDPFRARAYERAAAAIAHHDVDLEGLIARGKLTEIPGIGRGLAAMIEELHRTGTATSLEALRRRMPPGALDLARIPGLGLTKIAALHAALGITSVDELRAACEAGRVRTVRGIGPKTEQRLLDRIRALEEPKAVHVRLDRALPLGDALVAHLGAAPTALHVEIAGPLRRGTETIDRLVAVAASTAPGPLVGHALAFAPIASVTGRSARHAAFVLSDGLPAEVCVAAPEHFGAALIHGTGSSEHWTELEQLAAAKGLRLDVTGLAPADGGPRIPTPTEADAYRHLGLPFIPPELREGIGEIAAAREGRLPDDLVAIDDLRGLVHCHTTYSDGRHTVAEMARAADALGMRYLTITDHSPSAHYAGGLDVDRLRRQWDDIARAQEDVRVTLLRGTESDILADGALDYPDAILEQLDVIIASVHARHKMDADQMTARLVRAMRHPCFKIWGHGLGRLVLSRPPIECRVEEVLDAAAESGRAAIEINGDPARLDLEPRWLRAARERGLRFVVSTDAHSIADYGNQRYGVAMARRGWVRRGEVLNALDTDTFRRAVAPARRA